MPQRKIRSFDDDSIDLDELTVARKNPPPTPEQQKAVVAISEQSDFVSREVKQKKARKRSPYIIQKNIKMRLGMPELLESLTKKAETGSDQETIEMAIGILIKHYGTDTMVEKFNRITKDS